MKSHYESQQNEIKTIKPRQLEINLTDDDALKFAQKAGAYGMTVAQLLERFIGDLVHNDMYAEQWVNQRIDFGSWHPINKTFIRYLVELEALRDVLEHLDNIQTAKEDIYYYNNHPGELYPGELEVIKKALQYSEAELDDYWNGYLEWCGADKNFDDEIKKCLQWRLEANQLLGALPHKQQPSHER